MTPNHSENQEIEKSGRKKRQRFFQSCLLRWYKSNKRIFLWREPSRSPYEILIAEVMLQKTRAENIVEVYSNFLKKFPNENSLSNARVNEIEQTINILGLSKIRAKNLSSIAHIVVERGGIPGKVEDLMSFPGIGPYIANAILLSAFNERRAVVDTNICRIYSRVFSFESQKDPRKDKRIWIFSEKMLPKRDYRDFTWALMDFCAIICKPKKPLCFKCPIVGICDYAAKASFYIK
jgi:A/G-specific adenine glycosylase